MTLKKGQVVTIRCPWDGLDGDGDTWLQGEITKTIDTSRLGFALHTIRVLKFKWGESDEWGTYDGMPFVLAREAPGDPTLIWVDTWPRRRA